MQRQLLIVSLVAIALIAGIAAAVLPRLGREPATSQPAAVPQALPSFDGLGWVNGGPLTADSLAGHPVLVFLWSDIDPHSLEVLPEVESWHVAYVRYGVRVIGVYAPEFSFGADSAVAAAMVRRLGITFPVALDAGYQFEPRLEGRVERPTLLVANENGVIFSRMHGVRTADAQRDIRALLRKKYPDRFPNDPETPDTGEAQRPSVKFIYLGTSRVEQGPLADAKPGYPQTFTAQFRFQEEGVAYVPYPVGRWTPSAEGLTSARGGAADYVALRHEGGRVSAVIAPSESGAKRLWILANDSWLAPEDRGDDVQMDSRGASYVEVEEPRSYSIANARGPQVLKLSPEGPGLTVYCFTVEPKAAVAP